MKFIGPLLFCLMFGFMGYGQSVESVVQQDLEERLAEREQHIDGYVIAIGGDTIKGKLKLLNESRSCRKIKMLMPDSSYKTYNPSTAIGYKRGEEVFESNKCWEAPPYYDGFIFMKKVKEGELNMYVYSFKSIAFYNATVIWFATVNEESYVFVRRKSEDIVTRVKRGGFKGKMSKYLADKPELAKRIKKKELRYEDMLKIVWLYNNQY